MMRSKPIMLNKNPPLARIVASVIMSLVPIGVQAQAGPSVWSTGKIDVADASRISNPTVSAFLQQLTSFGRNTRDAMQIIASFDAGEAGYGKSIVTLPVNGSVDKMHLEFCPYGNKHLGPEKFFERRFVQFTNGSYWTHVDLEQRFPGADAITPRTAVISKDQNAIGAGYRDTSGVDLFPQTLTLWKHKVNLLSYLQGSTKVLFEIGTIQHGGHLCLFIRSGGTPEEIILDPERSFALVEHSNTTADMKRLTNVLEYQQLESGAWIPKKAETSLTVQGRETIKITIDVAEIKTVSLEELENSLHFSFAPGWVISDERFGRTFTVREAGAN